GIGVHRCRRLNAGGAGARLTLLLAEVGLVAPPAQHALPVRGPNRLGFLVAGADQDRALLALQEVARRLRRLPVHRPLLRSRYPFGRAALALAGGFAQPV